MFDNAYEALSSEGDARWAFGTGFADPLSGVDTTVPADVDASALAAYCLMLADDALVMSHRLQEWCTRAPELEDEVALANIGLDLLGQARLLLTRAGKADGTDRSDDDFAFLREADDFRNVRLVELDNGDFAFSMARLLVFTTWRLAVLQRLVMSPDPVLAAIAAKGVKEVTYHRDYAAQWVVRLGDGTELSHERMQAGLDAVWPYVGELFAGHPSELVDPASVRDEFDAVITQVLDAAGLARPESVGVQELLGRDGSHTSSLVELLAVMQSVARAHPGATW
ncbi:1,2-phenylacetyl-CoA epoxidase subunit PaaC [Kutzneria buriramensis]|uniref:Ring-1,2-phenylacetyl-CoA epoxidase subunit PaaC n=1 Tax=Kutzneria buriramensis TaxID=1045776 RepID=A0A3E0HPX5_9PSEU|nr:1,2-phenylacetyl-CoA epoxidase subunit PaaC [Kutzneria buriramensis]REH48612.1 ring-1,2-phenylacetyl-CoA epoxidase subunit PaaC [Kutzneria buriramensis]